MLTRDYVNYYLDAMRCYKKGYDGWIVYYGTSASRGGYTFVDASWFTFIFITFLIFPIFLDLVAMPVYIITYIIQSFIKEDRRK